MKELFKKARDLIKDETNWTTRALARNKEGHAVEATDPKAICWCLVGAIVKVSPDDSGAAINFLWNVLEVRSITSFNDNHTHEEVLALLDKAIEHG